MANDYERLRKEGYTEEEIQMRLSEPISQVSLSDAPMSDGREDKSATISDTQGHSMKTSNVMMGYNRKGLNLPSGIYANADELESAIITLLTEDSENKIIVCRSTGQIVDVATLASTVIERLVAGAGLTLTGISDKITNQTAFTYGIRGDEKAARVFMGGNQGLQLPIGEYVSLEELIVGMSDYVYMTKKEEVPPVVLPPKGDGGEKVDPPAKPGKDPLPPHEEPKPIDVEPKEPEPIDVDPEEPKQTPKEEQEEEKKEKHVVTKRRKWEKWQTIAIAAGTAAIMLVASLGLDDVVAQKQVESISQKANYSISQMTEDNVYETAEEAVQRAISEFSTGDTVFVEEGTRYDHESDKATDKHGIIGEGLRQEGNYTLEYVSVLDGDNKIIEVEFEEGKNVGDVVTQALEERGLSFDDVQVRVHIGGPVAGWIDMNDILSEESITPELIESKLVVESVYQGTQEDFSGTIDVSTSTGTVEVDVTNPDGTLVDEGSLVVGNDGETYKVDDIKLTEVTTTTTTEEKVGEKLTLSIDHLIDHAAFVAIAEAMLVGGVAALGAAMSKKKKEDEEKKEQEQKAEEEFEAASYTSSFDTTVQTLVQMPTKTDEVVETNEATNNDSLGGVKR